MMLIKGSMDSNPYIITGTFCNHSIEDVLKPLLLVYCASGSVSSFFSVIAIAAMVFCRLITLMTHRLILNLLLSIFCCSFSVAVQFLNLWLNVWEGKYATVCVIEAFVVQYTFCVMLLSVLMVTLHLTMMVLFPSYYLRLGKLEVLYFLIPWLSPIITTWIPLIHKNYGISGSWCWIRLYNDDCSPNEEGMILMFAVWYGELFIGLILNNIGLLIVFITLCKHAYRNKIDLDYKKALKQTLPLLVYPITYQFLSWFTIANRLYQAINDGRHVTWLFYMHAFSANGGFVAPIFTLLYLLSLHKVIRKKIKKWHCLKCCFTSRKKNIIIKDEEPKVTKRLIDSTDHLTMYGATVTCPTSAHLPRESEIDEEYVTE